VALRRWRSALVVLLLGVTPAWASEPPLLAADGDDEAFDLGDDDEAFDLGDDDEAFDLGDDEAFDLDEGVGEGDLSFAEPSEWTYWLTGFLRSDWALWSERFEENPLAKGRQSLDLMTGFSWRFLKLDVAGHVEYDVAYQVEREGYDAPTIEAYEWLLNTREVQLGLSLGDFEITLGRQIVAWGEGDMLSPIDVVNPRDMREPGQSDLSDIRLPVLATRVGWFQGGHRLELMVVHESEFGYRSPPRGPYSGLEAMISSGLLGDGGGVDLSQMLGSAELNYEHVQPRFALDQQEVYLRWLYNGSGFDVGAYFASFLDPMGSLSIDTDAMIAQVTASMMGQESGPLVLGMDHQRYHMVGVSGAHTEESVLLKWEVSVDIQRPISVLAEHDLTVFGATQRLELPSTAFAESFNVMMGVTWSGVQNLTLGAEFLSTILLDEPEGMLVEMSVPTLALRASYLVLDERLSLSAVLTVIGLGQGWLARADVSYDVLDTLKLGVGYVTYQPGDAFGAFYGITSHDRLFAGLRWDFQIL
jgi:hypothetical protein